MSAFAMASSGDLVTVCPYATLITSDLILPFKRSPSPRLKCSHIQSHFIRTWSSDKRQLLAFSFRAVTSSPVLTVRRTHHATPSRNPLIAAPRTSSPPGALSAQAFHACLLLRGGPTRPCSPPTRQASGFRSGPESATRFPQIPLSHPLPL